MKQRKDWLQHIRRSVIVLAVLCAMCLTRSGPVVPGAVRAQEPTPAPADVVAPLDVDRIEIAAIEPIGVEPSLWRAESPDGQKVLLGRSYSGHQLHQSQAEGAGPLEGLWARLYDVWLVDQVSGQEDRIAEAATSWSWAPDSMAFAYVTPVGDRGIAGALYVVDVADRVPRRIAEVDVVQGYRLAQWLATNEIVYVSGGHLWVVQPDGGNPHQLNDLHLNHIVPKGGGELAAYRGNVSDFEISPDGGRIAYTVYVPDQEATNNPMTDLWIADLDGQNARLIAEDTILAPSPWSPDGRLLAHKPYIDPDSWLYADLVIVNINEGTEHRIYEPPNRWSAPGMLAWSPDSRTIAFAEYESGEETRITLWISDADGGEEKAFENVDILQNFGISGMWWTRDGRALQVKKGDVYYRIDLAAAP